MADTLMGDAKGKKGPEPKRVLGRGLDALLPSVTASAASRVEQEYQRVPIEQVRPQKGQPRKHFDEAALDELASSIRNQGVIQPIIVRRAGSELEIVAGERRWRAAQRAGLHEVPVVIKDVAPSAAFELALVENLQRTDLDPIETAEAYQRLINEHGYTQETLAERLGKNRATVTNTLRLLQLPAEVRTHVVAGDLSEGHARALLSVREPEAMRRLAREAMEKKWSVRETEAAARRGAGRPGGAPAKPAAAAPVVKNPNVRDVEKKLAAALGMAVVIREDSGRTSGVVEIGYDDLDQLERFLTRILGE
jgi:ParB family chromosome partitioning protein